MLDVIRAPEVGAQEIPTPQKVVSIKSVRWRQQHRHLTNSEPNHNPIGVPSRVPGILAPVFEDSSGDPSVSPSDNSTEDPSPVPIINPASVSG